jgi:hypothetical protein
MIKSKLSGSWGTAEYRISARNPEEMHQLKDLAIGGITVVWVERNNNVTMCTEFIRFEILVTSGGVL